MSVCLSWKILNERNKIVKTRTTERQNRFVYDRGLYRSSSDGIYSVGFDCCVCTVAVNGFGSLEARALIRTEYTESACACARGTATRLLMRRDEDETVKKEMANMTKLEKRHKHKTSKISSVRGGNTSQRQTTVCARATFDFDLRRLLFFFLLFCLYAICVVRLVISF